MTDKKTYQVGWKANWNDKRFSVQWASGTVRNNRDEAGVIATRLNDETRGQFGSYRAIQVGNETN